MAKTAIGGWSAHGRSRYVTKIMLVMRLTAIILTVGLLNVYASGKPQHVTFSGQRVPLDSALFSIEQQTGFVFLYTEPVLRAARPVSLTVKDMPLDAFLDELFSAQPLLKYNIRGKSIFIYPRSAADIMLEIPLPIKGRVLDEKGQPLQAASVLLKGSTKAQATDAEGYFTMDVSAGDVLVVRFVGYQTQEYKITQAIIKDAALSITLSPSDEALSEVVINGGYYKTTNRLKTGSISKVPGREIERQPVASPLMSLQGKMAGVDITPITGIPGASPEIKIRGRNSIRYDGAYPMYIIDGVQVESRPVDGRSSNVPNRYDPLSAIGPDNIESIEILKDADATAIYGSRGANGVVLITTKKGRQGRMSVDLHLYKGIGKLPKAIDMLNTQQYLAMRREAFANAGITITPDNAPDLMVWDTTKYTNWYKRLLGNPAHLSNGQINLSGGNSQTTFRLGGGFYKETMIIPGDFGFQRASGQFAFNHASTDNRFRVAASASYGTTKNTLTEGLSTLMYNALTMPPNAPEPYHPDGSLNWEIDEYGNSSFWNLMAAMEMTNDVKSENLLFSTQIGYTILPGLTFSTNFGISSFNSNELLKTPITASSPVYQGVTGESFFTFVARRSWTAEPQLNYTKNWGDHHLGVIAGMVFRENSNELKQTYAGGFTSDALLGNFTSAGLVRVIADNLDQYRYASVFGRISYNWMEKYIINLSGNRDGSSKFGSDNRFGSFGSIGAGWIFSSEDLIRDNLPFLSLGKLRASYGLTGNDQIEGYRYVNTYRSLSGAHSNLVGLIPANLSNPDFRWEQTKKMEGALELGLFNNRIALEVTHYKHRISNQLTDFQLPAITGFDGILRNMDATLENRGWEFTLNTQNINNQHFKWNTSFNISISRNKLVKFTDLENSPYAGSYKIGYSVNIFYLYKTLGVNPETGVYDFVDANNDGEINSDDQVLIQNMDKGYFGGLSNTFSYRSLELSFNLHFTRQLTNYSPSGMPGGQFNIPVDVYNNRWMKKGDAADFQQLNAGYDIFMPFVNHFNYGQAGYVNSSFLRLRNLSLTWHVPPAVFTRLKMQDMSVYLQGQNLFTLTDYPGLDPETGASLPQLRMLTAGLQVRF